MTRVPFFLCFSALIAAAISVNACGGNDDAGDGDGPTNEGAGGPGSPSSSDADGGAPATTGGGDAGSGNAACPAFDVTLDTLTAHDTSASPVYDRAHFGANFGAASWVSQGGATIAVDPTKMDMSLNPVTPGHVSAVDVHTLVPSRPTLRWFAHVVPWFKAGGGNHVDIGVDNDTDAWAHAMIDDARRRGFDGVIVDWYGQTSYENSVTLRMQRYVATLPPKSFSLAIMMDKGIANLSEATLENEIRYVQQQYFPDPAYEREGGKPILMFFGVDGALGGAAMAQAKAATGGDMVWVTQGASTLANAWVDQSFDWAHVYHDGIAAADPHNLAGVTSYYSAVASSPKKAFGSMSAGFNGTLTKSVAWSKGKALPRDEGACLVDWSRTIDKVIPANVTRMQWVTWNDWEEGSQVESGVENDVAVTASVAGTSLRWTVTSGTGDESTIDHYAVYASRDGVHAARIATVAPGIHALDLGTSACVDRATSWRLEVVAVGKACVRDHASALVTYP